MVDVYLHSLAESWSNKLCAAANRNDAYQKALFAYALEGYLSVGYGLLVLLLAGWLAGVLRESLVAAAAAVLLKTFTGGAHLGTPTRCAVGGAAIFTGLGWLAAWTPSAQSLFPALWLVLLADNLAVWLYAPVAAQGKPLGARQRIVLGILARLAVLLLTLVCLAGVDRTWLPAVIAGASFQCLSLSKIARKLIVLVDKGLSRVTAAGG